MKAPRITIAGVQSGVGKTTISIGIMGALKRKGYRVQGFKIGPDFIDPSYHTMITGIPSRNLDSWMLKKQRIKELFALAMRNSDIAVIEGVMGLFDGFSGLDETGSTIQITRLLRIPIILIVDVWGMARSAAAIVLGYKKMAGNIPMAVILNRVGGKTHAQWTIDAIKEITGIQVVGVIPWNQEIKLPERHLGLIPAIETKPTETLNMIVDFISQHVDLDKIIELAKSAPEIPDIQPFKEKEKKVKIAIALDEAFNFYYKDGLETLERLGAEIIPFSPLHDKKLPDNINGLYIGGGFPEMFAKQLEENQSIQTAIKKYAEDEIPILAECGGLMYLTKYIFDFHKRKYKMIGLLDADTIMTKKLHLNYTLAETIRTNPITPKNTKIKGHEFHYSEIINIPYDIKMIYRMKIGEGIANKMDGWLEHSTVASYMHIHLASNIKIPMKFINSSKKFVHS
ncbi:MAG: cobyrinate a,c-diamide synthase [Thermoprotei archaeon]|jgi:cobyrinic acid a,c-diamide synthase